MNKVKAIVRPERDDGVLLALRAIPELPALAAD